MKLKKGDTVKVIKGKDKGKTSKIEKVFSKENKVLLLGINQYKRHMKARSQNQPSEIITIAKPLRLENVTFICPKCSEASRIGYSIEANEKMRICKKCNQAV